MEKIRNKINIKTYFKKGTHFIIPPYQRGYKWGEIREGDQESSIRYFTNSLINAFENGNDEYFIEAVTVVQESEIDPIILVDGQQRTTSLFLLFVALNEYELLQGVQLSYQVREDSHRFLSNLVTKNKEIVEDEDTQDIFYFKASLQEINTTIKTIKKENRNGKSFINFVKESVFLLFNKIPSNKAVNTFIALNGLKAVMLDEELVKSELLIKSSRKQSKPQLNISSENEQFGIEWKINEDRGKLARNWDLWLYWWSKREIKKYFFGNGNHHPLYFLLVTYWNLNKGEFQGSFSFLNFKMCFLPESRSAKATFEGLRKLQKTFEDLYNSYETYNFLGIILKTSNEKEKALQYYLDRRISNKIPICDYAKWSLIQATHSQITSREENESNRIVNVSDKEIKALDAIELMNEKYVYWDDEKETESKARNLAYSFLLLLNLDADNRLERKFDFSIWDNRSLEHIYPKSKCNELDFTGGFKEGSVHCIGNLVLLYGNDNSKFGAKDVPEKKRLYFNNNDHLKFQSKNLLHSMSVFASSNWREAEIIENKIATVSKLKTYYGIT